MKGDVKESWELFPGIPEGVNLVAQESKRAKHLDKSSVLGVWKNWFIPSSFFKVGPEWRMGRRFLRV